MLKQARCNLCGSSNYSILYKGYEGDIDAREREYRITDHATDLPVRVVKCRNCGLMYAYPRPVVRSLVSAYSNMMDELYVAEEAGRRQSARAILAVLKKLKKKGRMLDIGCATGFLLDEARKDGWEAYGVELSRWASTYAKEKLGLEHVYNGILKNAGFPDDFFDAVIMKDTIEHLTDPRGTLIEIRRIVKPDGIVCVNTPDVDSFISRVLKAKWWGIKQAHLYYFNRRTLARMFASAGFTPIVSRSHVRIFTFKYWVDRFENYNKSLHRLFTFLIERRIIGNGLVRIDLGDQIEVYARKTRSLKYLAELERPARPPAEKKKMKVVAVLPAYNAARTLKRTIADIPREAVDDIILVDDASTDQTVRVAKSLGLKVYVHQKNRGYGANQKTCYENALKEKADVVVMVHPDYQYDPRVVPQLIAPILEGRADAVFGSRMMKGGALEGGMPLWKHNTNILLTAIENIGFGTYLTEYHSGFRAYSAKLLRTVRFQLNSNGFLFDNEIIAQVIAHGFKIEEIPIRTRYFDEASTIGFLPGVCYGFGILFTVLKYVVHTHTPFKCRQFE